MDERRDPGEFYPGGRVMVRPDVAPPQVNVRWNDISGKPDFSDVAPLGEEATRGEMKQTMNTVIDKLKTSLLIGALFVVGSALADVEPLFAKADDIPGNQQILTNTQEYVDAKVSNSVNVAKDYTDAAVANATNAIPTADLSVTNDYLRLDGGVVAGSLVQGRKDPSWDVMLSSANGEGAHAEGETTFANSAASHTEGYFTSTMAAYAHAEGERSVAAGVASHAEGYCSSANGYASHAEGYRTWASNDMAYVWRGTDIPTNQYRTMASSIPPYVDHGPGSYNISPVGGFAGFWIGDTNLAEVISAAMSDATQAATDYTDAAIAALETERSWNRPGEWTLAYLPVMDTGSTVYTLVDISTNDIGMVFSNVTRRITQGLSARVYSESLDEYSHTEPPAIVALEVDGGGMASNLVVTVPETGMYTVKGVAANGTARQIKVPFSGSERSESASVYFTDSNNFRRVYNHYAAEYLGNASAVRSATDVDGNAYTVYSTLRPTFGAKNGWGSSVPYAIAPRFAATAAHYPSVPAARAGYSVTYPVSSDGTWTQTYTVKSAGGAFNLATWALTNGFLEAEVSAAGISDVLVIPLQDGWQFPQNECPWFATEEWVTNNYTSLYGLTIWAVTQTSEYGIPMTVTSADGNIYWTTPATLNPGMAIPRADVASLVGFYNDRNWWRVKVGDSGKPLWMAHIVYAVPTSTRQDILLSHFHWVGGGPNYVKAARIVAALCAQYNTPVKILQ